MVRPRVSHHIFGEPVCAPCDGVVSKAVSDVADNEGSSMDLRPGDGTGNYVMIDCGDFLTWLVHLQYDSARVETGDRVQRGDRFGAVGNSGFSQEPHLHFQVATRRDDAHLHGAPMRINGRVHVRNGIILMD